MMEREAITASSLAALTSYKGGSLVPEELSAWPRLPCLLSWWPSVTGVAQRGGGGLCALRDQSQGDRRRAAASPLLPRLTLGLWDGEPSILCTKWVKKAGREPQDPSVVTRVLEPSLDREGRKEMEHWGLTDTAFLYVKIQRSTGVSWDTRFFF